MHLLLEGRPPSYDGHLGELQVGKSWASVVTGPSQGYSGGVHVRKKGEQEEFYDGYETKYTIKSIQKLAVIERKQDTPEDQTVRET
jgi:hypothetical protein